MRVQGMCGGGSLTKLVSTLAARRLQQPLPQTLGYRCVCCLAFFVGATELNLGP